YRLALPGRGIAARRERLHERRAEVREDEDPSVTQDGCGAVERTGRARRPKRVAALRCETGGGIDAEAAVERADRRPHGDAPPRGGDAVARRSGWLPPGASRAFPTVRPAMQRQRIDRSGAVPIRR